MVETTVASSDFLLASRSGGRGTFATTLVWVLLGAIALVAGYALFAESLVRVSKSYQQPEFSHGYIIPLISAWIIWQRRDLIWALRAPGAPSGWLLVAAGLGIAFVSKAANIDSTPYLGLVPLLIGLGAGALGWRSAGLLVVPVGFLVFGFPLPNYTYVEVSTSLQLISSQLGARFLDLAGVPAFLDGNIIDLGPMKLQVAEACSGLRYLLPLLSFGVLCAYMYRAPWWAKLLVVAATVPLTIFLNGFRIAMTGLFLNFGNAALAEGFMHLFEGWVIFIIALVILFFLMFGLLRAIGWRGRMLDMLDFDRMAGRPGGHAPAIPRRAAAVAPAVVPRPLQLSVLTMVVAALLLVPLSLRPQVIPERPGLLTYPLSLGDWSGTPRFLEREIEEVLGTDDYILADFVEQNSGELVNLWIAYYGSQLGDSNIHSPTVCLPGAGWEYIEFGPRRTGLTDFAGDPLIVNRGVIVKGTERIVMYFWMEMRGESLHESHLVKYVNLRDSVLEGRSDGALVRLYTALGPDEPPAAGDARLLDLLRVAYPHLEIHVGP
jgi:exosortase D (VPLPA-CTERM-specific)